LGITENKNSWKFKWAFLIECLKELGAKQNQEIVVINIDAS